ncbi:MAG: Cys-tRNA(Pro) deacylase [Glaciecola sp.]|jgi:Cys-tRNA(Pro)/Cys-tRNA(Cys) deacylase
MTPAIKLAQKQKLVHTIHAYEHDKTAQSYGLEAAEKLNLPAERVFKTLVVALSDQRLAVAIIPVAKQLSMKHMAIACGSKKAEMADAQRVEKTTGYVLGGVSPLGQKKRLPTVIDSSAQQYPTIYVSAGRRGLEIELSPEDLLKVLGGQYEELCTRLTLKQKNRS